ncbi:DUF4815 domain-containing protein [Ostreibacterium oceani]|uniref:DUF4815 domain-containing protein n=1 Tax=Ostreibacterium oceani TaxID=2654998 RepID=A0A6N7EWM0_9GAMM|nr:DUF4815 domain-containing protein [Ostreibacterium oceani]MPV86912.1 DUF4815 domain-containing protein [Ostreibacterium oceani]
MAITSTMASNYQLGSRSRRNLRGVDPRLITLVETAIGLTTQDFTVIEGLRSPQRQRELYRQGLSWTLNSKHLTHAAHRRINDVIFKAGDIVRGGSASLDADTGALTVDSADVYLDGDIYAVPSRELLVATSGDVVIGVWLSYYYVTEADDPTLRNPALGTRGQNEAGAWRLAVTTAWGLSDTPPDNTTDAAPNNAPNSSPNSAPSHPPQFYAVYTARDGYLTAKAPPPHISGVQSAIAKYDRDSTGSQYIVRGLKVHATAAPAGKERYIIDAGAAQIGGYAYEYGAARPAQFDTAPELGSVDAETALAIGGQQRVNLNRTPIASITAVRVTREKSVTVTHANITNSQDLLPDASVVALVSVTQGGVTYQQGVDYQLTSGKVDWSLSGAEPAAGSTYSVTYHYIALAEASAVDEFGYTLADAVAGTPILTSYDHFIPRHDRLCLDAGGEPVMLRGIASLTAPLPPKVPSNLLLLATIEQRWTADTPRIIYQDGVRVVSMSTLNRHAERLDFLTEQVAQNKLELSASNQENGRKHGVFADPLLSDTLRDAGRPQTALIEDARLQLPITAAAHFFDLGAPVTLNYTHREILSQPLASDCMLINPYMAFDPIPPTVTLSPAVDRWTVNTESVVGTETIGAGPRSRTTFRSDGITETAAEFCRPIAVNAAIAGMGDGEIIDAVQFDGITVATSGDALADDKGRANVRFTIPEGVPAGQKLVTVATRSGQIGEAVFTADGTIANDNLTRVVTRFRAVDPLAQTFSLPSATQLTAVDVSFCAVGDRAVRMQIRETATGLPTQAILAEALVDAATLAADLSANDGAGRATRFAFDLPVLLDGGVEYALVILSDEPTPSLKVATLGGFDDERQRWITAQPYTVGVLLSSSNASTWTPHNDSDLLFALHAADYVATAKTIDIGTLSVTAVTDLYVLTNTQITAADTTVTVEATLPDGQVLTFADGQHRALPAAISGDITLRAVLIGSATFSPVLGATVQVLTGRLETSGRYITRAIPAGLNSRVRVLVDAFTPQGANVIVRAASTDASPDTSTWQTLTQLPDYTLLDDGRVELIFESDTLIDAANIAVEIELVGHAGARPFVENPRVLVIEA